MIRDALIIKQEQADLVLECRQRVDGILTEEALILRSVIFDDLNRRGT